MCLIVLAWHLHPDYPLVVAANRDEFFSRPSKPAAFWEDAPQILAGRDSQAGGSWLGISRQGRFAALTNYREGAGQRRAAPSRGALVADFLAGEAAGESYLAKVAARGADFNGFNLLVADGQQLCYFSNRGTTPCCLPPGIYGLSNHLLDTAWPKLTAAKAAFATALEALPAEAPFFDLLADREIVADAHLPASGVPLEWERILSAIFVHSPSYGTRASALLSVRRDGRVSFVERSFAADTSLLGEVRESFLFSPAQPGV